MGNENKTKIFSHRLTAPPEKDPAEQRIHIKPSKQPKNEVILGLNREPWWVKPTSMQFQPASTSLQPARFLFQTGLVSLQSKPASVKPTPALFQPTLFSFQPSAASFKTGTMEF